MADLINELEELSGSLFEARADDLDSLSELLDRLQALVGQLDAAPDQPAYTLAAGAAAVLQGCLEKNEHSPQTALDLVAAGLRGVQQVVRDGAALKDLDLPEQFTLAISSVQVELTQDTESDHSGAETNGEPSSSMVDPEMLAGFVSEANEHLDLADSQLLQIEATPEDAECLNAVFRAFHTIKGVAAFFDLKEIAAFAHQAENLLDRARNRELLLVGPAVDAAFASVDTLKKMVAHLGSPVSCPMPHPGQVRELVQRIERILQGETQAVGECGTQPAQTPEPGPAVPVTGGSEMAASTEPSASPEGAGAKVSMEAETIRVDRLRLDRLIDVIGELVIAESMVQQELQTLCNGFGHETRKLSQLNKITRNLQELSLSLRMVPLRATFQKMARLARDLSKKIGKPIDFQTSGEETELDKTLVDRISDPLMHMVRNSVDHGIEADVEERRATGKPDRGRVTLRAFHRGGNIYIEIEDDGRGLNRDRILAKARERGLVAEDAVLSEREIYDLIFLPGFSTAEKITDVSGRGVGMDVVRRNIQSLRGSVEVRSQPGQGTCLSIRLPLTLAIIEGMVVRVGQQRYIIPTLSIVELLRPTEHDVQTIKQRCEFLKLRDQQVPLIRLGELFSQTYACKDPSEAIVVVVEDATGTAGLLVDEVLGQQQAVIKGLGSGLENQPGLSGGAVMPDGKVGLILDVSGILALFRGVAAPAAAS